MVSICIVAGLRCTICSTCCSKASLRGGRKGGKRCIMWDAPTDRQEDRLRSCHSLTWCSTCRSWAARYWTAHQPGLGRARRRAPTGVLGPSPLDAGVTSTLASTVHAGRSMRMDTWSRAFSWNNVLAQLKEGKVPWSRLQSCMRQQINRELKPACCAEPAFASATVVSGEPRRKLFPAPDRDVCCDMVLPLVRCILQSLGAGSTPV